MHSTKKDGQSRMLFGSGVFKLDLAFSENSHVDNRLIFSKSSVSLAPCFNLVCLINIKLKGFSWFQGGQ